MQTAETDFAIITLKKELDRLLSEPAGTNPEESEVHCLKGAIELITEQYTARDNDMEAAKEFEKEANELARANKILTLEHEKICIERSMVDQEEGPAREAKAKKRAFKLEQQKLAIEEKRLDVPTTGSIVAKQTCFAVIMLGLFALIAVLAAIRG